MAASGGVRFREITDTGEPGATLRAASQDVRVRELYLSDQESGIQSALASALRELFRQRFLPDNPAYFLASVLGSFYDQSPVWTVPNSLILREVDESGAKVNDAQRCLCTLGEYQGAWGVPHIMCCLNLEGMRAVRDVLLHNIHDSFCRSPLPFKLTASGCITRCLCSVHGSTLAYNPARQAFPELKVRCDVLMSGPSIDEAVGDFAALILKETRDVQQMPLDFLVNVSVADTPASRAQKQSTGKDKQQAVLQMSAVEIEANTAAFFQMVKKAVLAQKGTLLQVVQVAFVLVIETPARRGSASTAFRPASKTYYLHVQIVDDAAAAVFVAAADVTHYAGLPYEALFDGVFLDRAAATSYMSLFEGPHGPPYDAAVLDANRQSVLRQVQLDLDHGNQLDAFRKLAHAVLLADARVTHARLVEDQPLPSLESLAQPARRGERPPLAAVLPDLFRILSSGTARLVGHAAALRAVQVLVDNFAAVRALRDGRADGPDDAVDGAPVFDPVADLLAQITQLKARLSADVGRSTFAGLSIMADRLLSQLPADAAAISAPAALSALAVRLQSLVLLVRGAAMTVADAMAFRCEPVSQLLMQLGVDVSSKAAAGGATGAAVFPEWVLAVQDVSMEQVKGGALPEVVAEEGVRMRYAVDTHLDQLLARVYREVTAPPLLRNPFGKVMAVIRCEACKMELWKRSTAELRAHVLNELSRVGPPGSFIYAGRASAARTAGLIRIAKGLKGPASKGPAGDPEAVRAEAAQAAVYGSYAAVQFADAVLLQRLRGELPGLLTGREFARGAYAGTVVCALLGDACLSGMMDLMDGYTMPLLMEQWPPSQQGEVVWQMYHHPRYSHTHAEHTYYVDGPSRSKAAQVAVAAVLDYLVELHTSQRTSHIVHVISVGEDVVPIDSILRDRGAVSEQLEQGARRQEAAAGGEVLLTKASLFAAVRDARYVPVMISFKLRASTAVRSRGAALCDEANRYRAGGRAQVVRNTPWDDGAFHRVFLSERDALTWWRLNERIGSPAQPFHYEPFAARAQQRARLLIADGADFVGALRLGVAAATATLDLNAAVEIGRGLASHAQELACWRRRLHSTSLLAAEAGSEFVRAKTPLLFSRTVTDALENVQRVLVSSKYSYFSGLSKQVLQQLPAVKDALASSSGVKPSEAQYLAQLELALQCCEISVGQNVYMTIPAEFGDAVKLPVVDYAGQLR